LSQSRFLLNRHLATDTSALCLLGDLDGLRMIVRYLAVRREEQRDCRTGTAACTLGHPPTMELAGSPFRAAGAAQTATLLHLPSSGTPVDGWWVAREAR